MSMLEKHIQELDVKYLSKSYHTFLFYLNVTDKFLVEDDPRNTLTLRQYLVSKSIVGHLPFTVQFNISRGLRLHNKEQEDLFLRVVIKLLRIEGDAVKEFIRAFRANKSEPDFVFNLLFDILRFSPIDLRDLDEELYEEVYPGGNYNDKLGLFSVYLNYLPNLIPSGSSSSGYPYSDRRALESILELAQSMKIRKSGNVIILAAESLSSIASQLSSETNGISCFKIGFPDTENRKKIYELVRSKHPANPKNVSPDQFSRLSSGMSTNIIYSFASEHAYSGKTITDKEIFENKKKFIDEKTQGLAKVLRPLWGMNAIGSLDEHKKYASEIIDYMKTGNNLAVPMGILFMGPPGTGKTVLAEAIAHGADVPLFILKNLRSMWHGQSEMNQEIIQEIMVAQAPVIGFIDEFDQQFQARGTMLYGDSGTTNRMQGKWLEFMSDTSLRGKILWIMATNMPASLDMAMREGRIDDWIPFFPPNAEERISIFHALIEKNRIAAQSEGAEFRIGKISEDEIRLFAKMCFCRLREGKLIKCSDDELKNLSKKDKEPEDSIYFTGGQMENLIRQAYVFSSRYKEPLTFKHLKEAYDDYNPPISMIKHNDSITEAIKHTNRLRFLPKSGRWKEFSKRVLGIDESSGFGNLSDLIKNDQN